ncbi:MAG: ACT domain-containing protein, partial [Elusimicrobiota bacterium]
QLALSVVDFFERGLVVGGVNLPPEFDPKTFERLERHLALAERLGRFLGQLLPGAWTEADLAAATKFSEKDQKVLANAGLRGILSCALGETVNVINASFYAKERGLSFQTASLDAGLAGLFEEIILTVRTREGRYASASGRVELSGELRIARIGDLLVNVVPHGVLVVIENLDLPGMIGKVGTLFGAHRVNIADMRVGRKAKGESAIMVLTLDGAADGPVLEELSRLEGVTRATLVKL